MAYISVKNHIFLVDYLHNTLEDQLLIIRNIKENNTAVLSKRKTYLGIERGELRVCNENVH
jgi:hypothetical protein